MKSGYLQAGPEAAAKVDPNTPKLLIYNPLAGARIQLPELAKICRKFGRLGWGVIPHPTYGPDTAAQIVREFYGLVDGVVVLGGDGTVNEVLPALVETELFLAVLPGGTANVLANELALPKKIDRAIACLVGGEVRRVTVGQAGERPFIAMSGIGFDGQVVAGLSSTLKRRLGKAAFVWESVRQLGKKPLPRLRFSDGREEWIGSFGVVSNCRLYGGRFVMAPQASLEDPRLDLCLFQSPRKGRFMSYFLRLARQSHLDCPDVVYRKLEHVEISSETDVPYQLDGEIGGRLPLTIRSRPGALRLLFPRPQNR